MQLLTSLMMSLHRPNLTYAMHDGRSEAVRGFEKKSPCPHYGVSGGVCQSSDNYPEVVLPRSRTNTRFVHITSLECCQCWRASTRCSSSLTHPPVVSAGYEHNSSDADQLKYGPKEQAVLQNLIENISFCKWRIYRHLCMSVPVNDSQAKCSKILLFPQMTP